VRVLAIGSLYPPHHLGGYELIWASAMADLRRAGHEVRVLASDWREPEPDPGIPEGPDVHRELRWYWHDHEFPRVGALERLALERANARTLRRHLAEFRPDAVSWWSMGGMSLSLFSHVRHARLPSAAVVCDDWLLYAHEVDAWTRAFRRRPRLAGPAAALTRLPTRPRLDAVGSWLFLSEDTRGKAERSPGPLGRTRVEPRGVDGHLFGPAPVRDWGWRLLYLGRIDERKGTDLAIKALPLLPAEATLAVVGPGDPEHLGVLRELAARLGVERRVRFERRARSEVPAAYAQADAVLFPVRWAEPWGLVPLEAMAVGRPVVATGRGGSGAYLRDGENSLLFDPDGGHEPLAAALRRLASDPGLRGRLREGGFETAARYSADAFNRAVLEELERVTHA
jgi:glycogen synthase